jgi:signal transduction histidine kinase
MNPQHPQVRRTDADDVGSPTAGTAVPEGGGKMGARVRAFDWAATSLGPREQWPQSLKTAVSICLASRFPMAICWGTNLIQIYNDAYGALMGAKHPQALGRPCYEVWSELRPILEPMFEGVLQSGEATWSDDLMLPTERHGYAEEAFFTISNSAIRDESGGIGGILTTVTETTARVFGERRLRMLRDLAGATSHARTVDEVCHGISAILNGDPHDIPFSLLYLFDETGNAKLTCSTGAQLSAIAAPKVLGTDPKLQSAWPISEIAAGNQQRHVVVPDLQQRFAPDAIVGAAWPESIGTAVIVPIARPGKERPQGLFIAGVSPRRRLDDDYVDFIHLVVSHITSAISNAEARATERHQAEGYELFMQAPAPFCVLKGPELVYEMANSAYLNLFGRPNMVGRPMLEAVPELRDQGLDDLLRRVMKTGVPHVSRETRSLVPRSDGRPGDESFWTFVYSPLRAPDETVDRVMVSAWEVTEQVRSRGTLELARRQAEEASTAKDQFLAMLGHELRNPLSPILTALQLMNLRGLRSREQEVIERQVGHLVRLVDDLLDVARITRGKVELRRDRIELASVVVRGIELATPVLEQRQQRLEVNVAPDGMMVNGDCDRLAQVVSNLLTNAAKYSEPGSRIWISAAHQPGPAGRHARSGRAARTVRLSIKDEGIGIAPDMLDSIFESFVQHRQALDRASGGLGLGLAIVRSLVRMHGGTVTAHSQGPGKGSEFRVELPLPQNEEVVALLDATEDSGRILLPASQDFVSSNRVLVVDDNHDGAQVLAETLRELGYLVEIAHDGPSALEIAKRFRPQIALLDIGLPMMDGYELASQLREQAVPGIRLVAVTGYGQETDRIRSAKAGFSAHLVKPVDLNVLSNAVRDN